MPVVKRHVPAASRAAGRRFRPLSATRHKGLEGISERPLMSESDRQSGGKTSRHVGRPVLHLPLGIALENDDETVILEAEERIGADDTLDIPKSDCEIADADMLEAEE